VSIWVGSRIALMATRMPLLIGRCSNHELFVTCVGVADREVKVGEDVRFVVSVVQPAKDSETTTKSIGTAIAIIGFSCMAHTKSSCGLRFPLNLSMA
jgi:hypothetical protein